MANKGFYIRVRSTGLSSEPILIPDISGDRVQVGTNGLPTPGPQYVPANPASYIDLSYTSTVALSYETGSLNHLETLGYITVQFLAGKPIVQSVLSWRGWGNYDDTGHSQSVPADIWTQLTNDGAGPNTDLNFMPNGITPLFNTTTNLLDFSQLSVGDRVQFVLWASPTPSLNNTSISIRANFLTFGAETIIKRIAPMSGGAGIPYPFSEVFSFYIGSETVRTGGASVDILCGAPTTVVVNGFYISIL